MRCNKPSEPQISLVALVRDEAADLRRLLTWHRHLYDEAIVVDTGSLDKSVAIATALGAQVTHFQWCDDFSAARNHGLARASGRWILVLDCDELIPTAEFSAIRQLTECDDQAWQFQQRNYCGAVSDPQWVRIGERAALVPNNATGYIDVATCRLFPSRSDVRYEGVVHELPNQALQRAGIPLNSTEFVVHHYGHLVCAARSEIKNSRYDRLLRKKLHKQPKDPQTRYEMAVQLVNEGQTGLAQRLLTRTVAEMPEHQVVYRARLLLGRLLVADGQAEAGVCQMETAVREWPALRAGWLDTARAHAQLGHHQVAARYLAQGRRLFPHDSILCDLATELSLAPNGWPVDRILSSGAALGVLR